MRVSEPVKKFVLVVLSLLLISSFVACNTGQLSRKDAIELLKQEMKPDEITWDMVAFSYAKPLKPGDIIGPARNPDNVREVTADEWFFWIDHNPYAMYAHETTFVFIQRDSGDLSFFHDEWWPVLNDEPLFTTDKEYWDRGNWAFSTLNEEEIKSAVQFSPEQYLLSMSGDISDCIDKTPWLSGVAHAENSPVAASDKNYALVVNGWHTGEEDGEGDDGGEFNVNCNTMHDIFTSAGFETTYMGPIVDLNPDRDGPASPDEIKNWIEEKAKVMTPCHTLMVYITAHGGKKARIEDATGKNPRAIEYGFVAVDDQDLNSNDLRDWLKSFKHCVHIHVIIDGCYTGSFIDDLKEVCECVVTSTSEDVPAYFDCDFLDPNPEDEGTEFSSGFAQGIQEILNDPAKMQQAESDAQRTGRSLWQQITTRAMKTALDNLPRKERPTWHWYVDALIPFAELPVNPRQHPTDWYMGQADREAKCLLPNDEDGGGTVTPEPETPPEPPVDTIMTAEITPVVEIVEDESGCRSSIMTVDFIARDLTGGDSLLNYVEMRVDGEEWDESGDIKMLYYDKSVSRNVSCKDIKVIEVDAVNNKGRKLTVTREFHIPPLGSHFTYGFLDTQTEECLMLLVIDLQGVSFSTENEIVNVVLTANGTEWFNSGDIATDDYEKTVSKEVGCGHIYQIDVIATDSAGNKYTYRETVIVPDRELQDQPLPPVEPPPAQETLYVAYAANAQCTQTMEKCDCILVISCEGKDLTGGDYPVTRLVLKVDGSVWEDSATTLITKQKTVGCGTTHSIEVTVYNSAGQTVTTTGTITTPVP